MMERWITDVLDEIAGQDADAALRRLCVTFGTLHARGALFAVQTLPATVYRWAAHPNGTARPGSAGAYPALADAAADALHGQELLAGHGVMRRVVPRHAQGRAELIGEPVRGEQGGLVSLVVSVRVLSLPGLSRPLVALTPYRPVLGDCGPRRPRRARCPGMCWTADAAHPAHAFVL